MKLLLALALASCVPDLVAAKKNLRDAVDDTQEDLDACYAKSLERDADGKGEMTVVLHVVSGDGRVESVKVSSTELSDPKLDKCLKLALMKVRVKPVPPGDFDIDYTLQLGSQKKSKKPADDE